MVPAKAGFRHGSIVTALALPWSLPPLHPKCARFCPQNNNQGEAMNAFEALAILALALAWYLLPTLVAVIRKHHNAMAIFLLNLFLGWSVIGWVVALVWSFTKPPPPQQVVVNVQPGPRQQ